MLTLSAVHIAGALAWFALPDLTFTVPRYYLLAKNLAWTLAGCLTAAGLFLGRPWSLPLARGGAIVYPLWCLADRALLSRSDYAERSLPLTAAIHLLGAALVIWILSRPSVKAYLRSNPHEQLVQD